MVDRTLKSSYKPPKIFSQNPNRTSNRALYFDEASRARNSAVVLRGVRRNFSQQTRRRSAKLRRCEKQGCWWQQVFRVEWRCLCDVDDFRSIAECLAGDRTVSEDRSTKHVSFVAVLFWLHFFAASICCFLRLRLSKTNWNSPIQKFCLTV